MLPLKSKKLLFKTNSAMFKRSAVADFFCFRLSRVCLSAFNPTSCVILGYNPTISTVANVAFSGAYPLSFTDKNTRNLNM